MGWWRDWFGRGAEQRSPGLAAALGFDALAEGLPSDRASGLAVAYACIRARAEATAALPLHLYRRLPGGGREEVADGPIPALLNDSFDDRWAAFDAREALSAWADASGNAFARVEFDDRGAPVAIHPCLPGSVTIERLDNGRVRYRHTDEDGTVRVLLMDEVLHLRHRTRDGLWGEGPIQMARETVGLAADLQSHAAAFTRNGARPSGMITLPTAVSAEAMASIKAAWERSQGGPANAGKLLVMDGGADFKPFGMTSRDAEFLESRKLANLDIARLFGVPPTVAGIPDHATYSNVTQENRAFVARCLAPWARRIEAALNRALLTPEQRRTLFVEHDLSGLLRGDVEARFEAYRIGREIGALSANDVRRRENEPPVEGGDTYHMPANWQPLGAAPEGGE